MSNKVIGGLAHQAPRNADLGTLAFQDSDSVGSIKARTIVAGRIPDTNDAYALTLSRVVGSSGILRIIGDSYLTGNGHIKFENTATAGAVAKNAMMTFDGTQLNASALKINTAIGEDHVSGTPSLDIYHYNYPDDGTTNVPALRIRSGNTSADMQHHGFLSLESLFTGASYESPRIYFRNNANASNDKAIAGVFLSTGTEPNLTFVTDLLGSSENYSDITPYIMATISKSGISLGSNQMSANGGSFYNNGDSVNGYGIMMDTTVSSQDRIPTIRQVARYNAGTVTTAEIYTDSSGTIYQQLNSSRVHTFKSNGQTTLALGGLNVKSKVSISGTETSASITTNAGDWVNLASVPYGESNGRIRIHWDNISAPSCCHHGYAEFEIGSWYGPTYYYGWDSNISIKHYSAHNSFKFFQYRLIDAGNKLYFQGRCNKAIVSGSISVRIIEDNSYAPGAVSSGITPLTPIVHNTYYSPTNAFVEMAPGVDSDTTSWGSNQSGEQVMQGTSGMHYARHGYQDGSTVKKSLVNPNGVAYKLRTATNGAASWIKFEGNQYNGYVSKYYSCYNASGNWYCSARNSVSEGTAPTITLSGNGTANPTLTLGFNTGYSGGFCQVEYFSPYWRRL